MANKPRKKRSLILRLFILFVMVVAAGAAGLYVNGNRHDEEHVARASEVVSADVGDVFALHADPKLRPSYLPRVKEIRDFQEQGDGKASWTEEWSDGNVFDFVITEIEKNKRVKFTIDDRKKVFHGSWDINFEKAEGGTRVSITENGVIPNVFIRGGYHLLANTDDEIKKYLAALKDHYAKAE